MRANELKAFVKWSGGPSLWLGEREPRARVGEVIEDLSEDQKTSIDLLMTEVMNEHSSITYSSHPIPLNEGHMEKLLKILHRDKSELFARWAAFIL